ncbi:MAG: nucleotidyltransferase [Desulfocapsaceae bacterium]|nr:nucleotidyltransferase [Desulfocapsaceae bacterium]
MADIQKQFEKFHDNIRLANENRILKEKRDVLKNNLGDALKKNDDAPTVDKYLLQGSYAIHTGINPPNSDYDIDIGVVFDCTKEAFGALKLKNIVKEALDHSSRDPKLKNPCITIQYTKDGEDEYHVDMPVYVKRDDGKGYDLAWGKNSSSEDWLHSDPEGLVDEINGKYSDEDERAQFRRVVKYLKAWKGMKFTAFTIPSIGLTLSTWEMFAPDIDFYDNSKNDLAALKKTVARILSAFRWVAGVEGKSLYRLQICLPVSPRNDVFEKLTDQQMTELKDKMESLLDTLKYAENEERSEKACKELKKHLPDFPVPSTLETAKASVLSLNNTGSSS